MCQSAQSVAVVTQQRPPKTHRDAPPIIDCSFCGEPAVTADIIVKGDRAQICGSCIEACWQQRREEQRARTASPPTEPSYAAAIDAAAELLGKAAPPIPAPDRATAPAFDAPADPPDPDACSCGHAIHQHAPATGECLQGCAPKACGDGEEGAE